MKTFRRFKINFEYLSDGPVLDTENTTAIALAMNEITSDVSNTPDEGEGKFFQSFLSDLTILDLTGTDSFLTPLGAELVNIGRLVALGYCKSNLNLIFLNYNLLILVIIVLMIKMFKRKRPIRVDLRWHQEPQFQDFPEPPFAGNQI